ncbi:MAG: ribonuclease III [Alphaproteobacteria bacterium]|nr:ribonuclease III [Alphaproteobacteria bacterium]
MKDIEEILSYSFKNPRLLSQALTHPSALPSGQGVEFERLEFLGDRVLGLVVSQWLFEEFPSEKEGDLAKRLAGLVRKETLVDIAKLIDLDSFMVMKREKSTSGNKRLETLLADGCEALIGALYLDGGLEVSHSFIHHYWKDLFKNTHEPPRDSKSILQEWAQGKGKTHPEYVVVGSSGPAHAPRFIIQVNVNDMDPAIGEGSSKRLAEQKAAQNMLNMIHCHD